MENHHSSAAPHSTESHGPNVGHGVAPANTLNTSYSPPSATKSPTTTDTYYIYSFDNKLMAEYDHKGTCVKNYLYLGNRLLAVYFPQTDTYPYHMSDQINSTRIVTDDNGDVVHSAAYGPFGEPQKTWTNTYEPKLKFSGKERETYSGLDYFGARYYDSATYRFNSVDPIMTREEALVNPQLWNLYAYCQNNPITHMDPDGRDVDDRSFQLYADGKLRQEWGNERADAFIAFRDEMQYELTAFVVTEAATAMATGGAISLMKRSKYVSKVVKNSSKFFKSFSFSGKIFKNPSKYLKGKTPSQIMKIRNKLRKSGWIEGTLGKGRSRGKGFIIRETGKNGNLTGRMIQFHPGGGHHGPNSYWKISSGNGIKRIFN